MSATTRTVLLRDGRTLIYSEFGDPKGDPVFYAHGGPGSRLEGHLFDETAKRYGFRLIAADRPGMGGSTFQPRRRIVDHPTDVVELADRLSIDRFGIFGWSGGGAHAIACSYTIPDRLTFALVCAAYTSFVQMPDARSHLDQPLDRRAVGWALNRPRLFNSMFRLMGAAVKYAPGTTYRSLTNSVSGEDQQILRDPGVRDLVLRDQREAFIQGPAGPAHDARVHYVDWGFHLSYVRFPVVIFHGDADRTVPLAFGRHLATSIPDCRLHVVEGKGHWFPVTHQELLFETARGELIRSRRHNQGETT